jgi:hypothetical protein
MQAADLAKLIVIENLPAGTPTPNLNSCASLRPDTTFWSIDTEALLRNAIILKAPQYTLRTTQGRLITALRRPTALRHWIREPESASKARLRGITDRLCLTFMSSSVYSGRSRHSKTGEMLASNW